MKYSDSLEKSGEYLRLVLPMMSKHQAAFNPLTYSVWYEHVSGINKPLSKFLNELTQKGATLDDGAIAGLYQQFISDFDEATARRLQAGFQHVLADMSQAATKTGHQATHFGETLAGLSTEMKDPSSGQFNEKFLDTLANNTHLMQDAIGSLSHKLEESQKKIEQLRKEVEKAREDALGDALSGLRNRRGFDLALSSCIRDAQEEGHPLTLLISDIDHFKKINDTYGHLFGDKVIRAVAKVMKDNIKGKDIATRYGGEEFAILLPETTLEGARIVAEKIRSTIETSRIRRADTQQEMTQLTISLGVTSYRNGETAEQFVSRADKALYAAKTEGRNRVKC